ncbi:hypothetical protein GCM10023063_49570 [Arthrobacter methylotrophus]|uniref:aldehyde dehydrogenase family protein n=1 Tax=Arthrobacter methylotrophus TaxID=121291 RepID=UPI0031E91D89
MRRVNFTGSTHVGRIIAQHAARHLKPALLELGGKAPVLVLDDADLDAAVDAIAFGAFFNQGQICMSTERVIVDRKIADALVDKLAAKARTLRAGDPDRRHRATGRDGERGCGQGACRRWWKTPARTALRYPSACTWNGAIVQPAIVDGVTTRHAAVQRGIVRPRG